MEIKKSLGERIKELRQEKHLKQQEVAATLNVSQGFLSAVERGEKVPGSEFILALKNCFGVSSDWLLTGEGEAYPKLPESPKVAHRVCEPAAQYGVDRRSIDRIPYMREFIGKVRGLPPDKQVLVMGAAMTAAETYIVSSQRERPEAQKKSA